MTAALFPDLVINGETVPHALIAAEVQNHDAPKGKPGIAWRKAANAVALRTLLLQEARHQGIVPAPEEIGPGRFETEEEALIRGLLDTSVTVEVPSDNDVRDEWARDPSRFRAPPLWEVSHILVACDPRDETKTAEAREQAIRLAEQVEENPRRFSSLVSEHSDCGSKASGGALGQLGPGDTVPEFEEALRNLDEGEIARAPVHSRYGWHVIRMDAAVKGDVLPFEVVRGKIAEAMEKAAWARAARAFVDELIASAEIVGADLKDNH